jgi:lipopolysaccharide transport system ATP-binding protein
MCSDSTAIKVTNLSKRYEIYENPRERLKQFLFSLFQNFAKRKARRYFQEFWALNDVSFEIKKGETIGIIGSNGSGKSTLLQLICGTLNPTSGSVQTTGRIAALLELGSGFNPEFTGHENIYMNASILGLTPEEIDARFNDIVTFADIGEFIDQPVKTYSSGMMVRLAFSVIAHVDADILIVDEALAVGDAFFTQKCMRFLRNFMTTGTVLFVSHDTGAIVNLCTKAILLHRGAIIELGTPKDVIESYLATVYESTQEVKAAMSISNKNQHSQKEDAPEFRDMREEFVNASNLRNDIEMFQFNPEKKGFGTGEVKISSVRLLDQRRAPLSWIVGGEYVILDIRCLALKELASPIVGFQFKDRLGQIIFADNTFLAFENKPQPVRQGGELVATFEFRIPVMPSGDYTVAVAVADGSQDNHIQHHWMHEALIVRVHASSVCFGLVGVPMKQITLTTE